MRAKSKHQTVSKSEGCGFKQRRPANAPTQPVTGMASFQAPTERSWDPPGKLVLRVLEDGASWPWWLSTQPGCHLAAAAASEAGEGRGDSSGAPCARHARVHLDSARMDSLTKASQNTLIPATIRILTCLFCQCRCMVTYQPGYWKGSIQAVKTCQTCARAKGDSEGCPVPRVALGGSCGRMEAGAIAKGDSGPGAAAEAGVADRCCTCIHNRLPLS